MRTSPSSSRAAPWPAPISTSTSTRWSARSCAPTRSRPTGPPVSRPGHLRGHDARGDEACRRGQQPGEQADLRLPHRLGRPPRPRRCHSWESQPQLGDMSAEARTLTMREGPAAVRARSRERPPSLPLEEFEQVYRRTVAPLMGYFARRCREPQTVADLTSETFVRAATGFARFDPGRGSDRAWLFGIAAHVFAHHCEQWASGWDAVARLGAYRPLDGNEIEELAERIDAERDGAALMQRCAQLPAIERAALERVR